jgi:hypothetical protein
VEPFLLPVFVASMIKKVTDLVAFASAKDWKAVAKQVIAWAVGVASVALVKASGFADDYVLPGVNQALSDLNAYGTVLIGVLLASGGSVVSDVIASRDNHSSAYVPPLGGPPDTTPPAA